MSVSMRLNAAINDTPEDKTLQLQIMKNAMFSVAFDALYCWLYKSKQKFFKSCPRGMNFSLANEGQTSLGKMDGCGKYADLIFKKWQTKVSMSCLNLPC